MLRHARVFCVAVGRRNYYGYGW